MSEKNKSNIMISEESVKLFAAENALEKDILFKDLRQAVRLPVTVVMMINTGRLKRGITAG